MLSFVPCSVSYKRPPYWFLHFQVFLPSLFPDSFFSGFPSFTSSFQFVPHALPFVSTFDSLLFFIAKSSALLLMFLFFLFTSFCLLHLHSSASPFFFFYYLCFTDFPNLLLPHHPLITSRLFWLPPLYFKPNDSCNTNGNFKILSCLKSRPQTQPSFHFSTFLTKK